MFFLRFLLHLWTEADDSVADSRRLSAWIVFPLVIVILGALGHLAWLTFR